MPLKLYEIIPNPLFQPLPPELDDPYHSDKILAKKIRDAVNTAYGWKKETLQPYVLSKGPDNRRKNNGYR